jgi:polysaccharide export outer membrane protein
MATKIYLNYIKLICLFSGLIIGFSSCSNKPYQTLFEPNGKITANQPNNFTIAGAYKIKPEDILQVRNLQNIKFILEDVNTSSSSAQGSGSNTAAQAYPVEQDGTVALPVIGHVAVAGLTRQEASKAIEDMYRNKLIKDPIIEVKIINLKVSVFGEVRSPGNYALVKDKTTLIDVLGQAGGITDKGNEKRVKIIRGGTVNPQVTEINLSELESLTNPAVIMQNDDIVYVGQNKRAVRNDKIQNISTIVQPTLLLLNTVLLLFTLK